MVSLACDIMSLRKEYKKCGDIITSVDMGKNVFALNCIFCATICLQFESFTMHMEEKHKSDLYRNVEDVNEAIISDEDDDDDDDDDAAIQVEQEHQSDIEHELNEVHHKEVQRIEKNTSIFQDPLEDSQFPMMAAEIVDDVEGDMHEDLNYRTMAENTSELFSNDDKEDQAFEVMELMDVDRQENSYDSANNSINDEYIDGDDDDNADDVQDDEDRELTLAIIKLYKKHHILWNTNESISRNRKKRDDAFRKIAQTINKQMAMQLSASVIRERIKKMRFKFRSELQNEMVASSTGERYTPLWYYDKLSFLKESIKYKQRNKRGTKVLAKEKPVLPLPNLTDAQNIELIEMYKSFPCLWNVQHIGFRFKNQRHDAFEEMLETVRSRMNLDITQNELQKKIYRIRYACTQEKHLKLQAERLCMQFTPTCKYYSQIEFLEDHVGPFKCIFCEKTFNGPDQYKIHKSQHDGSMPFTCPICNRGFMKVGNCTVHLRRHTRDYPFECTVCKKRYATTTDLNVHMRYHTGEKPYFCEVCGQSFRTWTFFDSHNRRHKKRPSHTCSICSKSYYEKNKLTEHMKAHLNVRDKVCNICGKAFTSSKYLCQHKQIHAEKKKYVCKICGKDFAQYAGLSGHMKSHGTTVTRTSTEVTQ